MQNLSLPAALTRRPHDAGPGPLHLRLPPSSPTRRHRPRAAGRWLPVRTFTEQPTARIAALPVTLPAARVPSWAGVRGNALAVLTGTFRVAQRRGNGTAAAAPGTPPLGSLSGAPLRIQPPPPPATPGEPPRADTLSGAGPVPAWSSASSQRSFSQRAGASSSEGPVFAGFTRDVVTAWQRVTSSEPATGCRRAAGTVRLPRKRLPSPGAPEKRSARRSSRCTKHPLPGVPSREGNPPPASPHSQSASPHPRWLRSSFTRYSVPNSSREVRFPAAGTASPFLKMAATNFSRGTRGCS